MKIKYLFINGESSDVEVADELGALLLDLDRLEYNNNQAETRRHASLETMDYEGEYFATDDYNLLALTGKVDEFRLHNALSKLKPKQQELLKAIYIEGISVKDYAAKEGVEHSAISHRLETAKNNLKKLL